MDVAITKKGIVPLRIHVKSGWPYYEVKAITHGDLVVCLFDALGQETFPTGDITFYYTDTSLIIAVPEKDHWPPDQVPFTHRYNSVIWATGPDAPEVAWLMRRQKAYSKTMKWLDVAFPESTRPMDLYLARTPEWFMYGDEINHPKTKKHFEEAVVEVPTDLKSFTLKRS